MIIPENTTLPKGWLVRDAAECMVEQSELMSCQAMMLRKGNVPAVCSLLSPLLLHVGRSPMRWYPSHSGWAILPQPSLETPS